MVLARGSKNRDTRVNPPDAGCHQPALLPQDMDHTYSTSPEHVCQSNVHVVRNLPWAGRAAHVPEDCSNLPQAGRTSGMPHGDKLSTTVDRDAPGQRYTPIAQQRDTLTLRC